jgi:hypothetical protein
MRGLHSFVAVRPQTMRLALRSTAVTAPPSMAFLAAIRHARQPCLGHPKLCRNVIFAPSHRLFSTQLLPKPSFLSRALPGALSIAPQTSSLRKIISLAKPERKYLGIAIGLLLVSSCVSMSVPFTIGKLIDFFSSPHPVRLLVTVHTLGANVVKPLFGSKFHLDCLPYRPLVFCCYFLLQGRLLMPVELCS